MYLYFTVDVAPEYLPFNRSTPSKFSHFVPDTYTMTLFTDDHNFSKLASLGGGPQAHVHMKDRVLNVLGMNALFFCEPKATPAPYP